jgi:hypothetical protein
MAQRPESAPHTKRSEGKQLLRLMTKRVGVALRLQQDKGVVEAVHGPGQYNVWE